jgi:RNA-directed DNA polymerase
VRSLPPTRLVVLCPTRERAERARSLAEHALGPLGLQLHPDKTQIVGAKQGAQGFDFLGFHHRMVEPRKRRGRYWMHKWPSRGRWPPSGPRSVT